MAHRIHEDSETTKQIESSGRAAEDLKMFSRMWLAGLRRLAKMYAEATPPMILWKKSPDVAGQVGREAETLGIGAVQWNSVF